MSDVWKHCEYAKRAAHLLAPVLETLLALGITVLLMEEVQRDERADHASEDSDSDDDVDPLLDLRRGVGRLAARAVRQTVVGAALLVGVALLPNGLGLDADQLLRVAVETHFAVTPEDASRLASRIGTTWTMKIVLGEIGEQK